MTPRTIHPLCVSTSQTRRYSDLFGLHRQHTPMKSRKWLHELAHLQASPLISYDHVFPPKEFSPSLACAPLGMYFAQVYAVTGISPPPNSVWTRLRSSPPLKLLLRLTPFRTVSSLDFSATHGPGVTSSQAPPYWSPLNPEYRRHEPNSSR